MCELWIWSMRVGRWEKTSPQPSHRHVTVSPGSAGGAEDGPGEPRSSARNAETSPASLADDESSRITDDCENDGDGERSSAGDGEYVELACAIVELHKTNKWPARCSRRRPAAVCRCLVQLACRRSPQNCVFSTKNLGERLSKPAKTETVSNPQRWPKTTASPTLESVYRDDRG